jgi:prephenate dehydratase
LWNDKLLQVCSSFPIEESSPTSERDIFDDLQNVTLGVVPQENSTFGGVAETYDALCQASPCIVRGEVTIDIQHCLVVREGVEEDQIECILSHEQVGTTYPHMMSYIL